ncbi:MAG: dipeptide epimerase [Halobacteriales archaeon]
MGLSASAERLELPLERPFTIARGTVETAEPVVVRVRDDAGREGVGAAAPSARFGETVETVEAVLPALFEVLEAFEDPSAVVAIEDALRERVRGNAAARAAVSIAVHDLAATRAGLALHRLWGLPSTAVETSYTVGIDDPEAMADHAEAALERGHGVLKVKLGTDDDRARIDAVRAVAPEARIRVDANEAWRPKEAIAMAEHLARRDVEFVEQPVPAEHPEALAAVTAASPIPVAADESCVSLADVPRVARVADIANLKLMKCGGLVEARRMVHAARAHGLEVMLGCMTETNASIAAAAQLAPMLDYADLDGSLLLAADPYDGPVRPDGTIDLDPATPGTGAVRTA